MEVKGLGIVNVVEFYLHNNMVLEIMQVGDDYFPY